LIAVSYPNPYLIIVLSLSINIFFAIPKSSSLIVSIEYPLFSVTKTPPVTIAISYNICFFLSPNCGAFTAATSMVPLSLLRTSSASAYPSTSSAIINSGFLTFAIF